MAHLISLITLSSLLLISSCGGGATEKSTGIIEQNIASKSSTANSTIQSSSKSSPQSSVLDQSSSSSNSSSSVSSLLGSPSTFNGNLILGNPTPTSIKANIYAENQSGELYISYGTASNNYTQQTQTASITPNNPLELTLDKLNPNTRYYYRLYFKSQSDNYGYGEEYSFQTPRRPGESFTFAIQGDSHPEREKTQFDGELYKRTLLTAANDKPDFYLTSGDDFSVDNLDPVSITQDKVVERYRIQRPYLGLIGRSAPLFLVNGNHEQAARYLLDGTPNNVAVWAQNARNSHYSEPAPDDFYSGNSESVPYIGLLRNYYAWTWGDALFVVIDPYWASPVAVDNMFGSDNKRANMWDVTHGDAQYDWLKRTLEQSTAKYKFVFAHHVMGTGRGGVELTKLWEWGGENAKGVFEFNNLRTTWAKPIHKLMVDNKVTIFFQGHDHIWVHQQIDGITYQTLSDPANPNYTLNNSDAFLTGDKFASTGYTRVTVSAANVKVEYVRTYLPKDEFNGKTNGEVAFRYFIP